ncbi:hypothetical protein [Aliamphritea hakodatensis]|uniref:hypothetical protein n=1 Tax=Aliamphritea hakodatensis TaxID=2895352 RepID=UPI0022FD713A|nr:hypothetical protein [Aliamphritea hakodatensis]
MSNDYFSQESERIPGTRARAENINKDLKGIEAGFDKLPNPRTDERPGFSEPIAVPEAIDDDQAATFGQAKQYANAAAAAGGNPAALPVTALAIGSLGEGESLINRNGVLTGGSSHKVHTARSLAMGQGDELEIIHDDLSDAADNRIVQVSEKTLGTNLSSDVLVQDGSDAVWQSEAGASPVSVTDNGGQVGTLANRYMIETANYISRTTCMDESAIVVESDRVGFLGVELNDSGDSSFEPQICMYWMHGAGTNVEKQGDDYGTSYPSGLQRELLGLLEVFNSDRLGAHSNVLIHHGGKYYLVLRTNVAGGSTNRYFHDVISFELNSEREVVNRTLISSMEAQIGLYTKTYAKSGSVIYWLSLESSTGKVFFNALDLPTGVLTETLLTDSDANLLNVTAAYTPAIVNGSLLMAGKHYDGSVLSSYKYKLVIVAIPLATPASYSVTEVWKSSNSINSATIFEGDQLYVYTGTTYNANGYTVDCSNPSSLVVTQEGGLSYSPSRIRNLCQNSPAGLRVAAYSSYNSISFWRQGDYQAKNLRVDDGILWSIANASFFSNGGIGRLLHVAGNRYVALPSTDRLRSFDAAVFDLTLPTNISNASVTDDQGFSLVKSAGTWQAGDVGKFITGNGGIVRITEIDTDTSIAHAKAAYTDFTDLSDLSEWNLQPLHLENETFRNYMPEGQQAELESIDTSLWASIQSVTAADAAGYFFTFSFDDANWLIHKNGVNRVIASSEAAKHSGTDGNWYYLNNSDVWQPVSGKQAALQAALVSSLNQMNKDDLAAIDWSSAGFTPSLSGMLYLAILVPTGVSSMGTLSIAYTSHEEWIIRTQNYRINIERDNKVIVQKESAGTEDVKVLVACL